ncbi:MAG: restriction endonuclease subunit S [Dechloromonas sp.]|nr:MAG: restriction endonuclease subunit S [Dechloromonas sp.]
MSSKGVGAMREENKPALVPRLRFPEFRDAGAWELKPLGQLAHILDEKAGNKKLTLLSVTSGVGLVSQIEKFGREIAGAQYKNYYVIQRDDFAYNKSSTKDYPEGFVARYQSNEIGAVPNSIFTCFRINPGASYPPFLDYLFFNNLHGKWLRRFVTVGARAHGSLNVDDNDLLAAPVPVPPKAILLDEQKKIANCLSSLDDLITVETQKLDALKTHKKGLMQQLFPAEGETVPRLRFPEFSDAEGWEKEWLEDLAKRGSGHTPSKAHPEYYDGGIKWVSLADSKRLDAGLITETTVEISAEGIANSSAALHPAGAVLLSRDAAVGKSAVMGKAMAVSQHFIVWTCNPTRLSNWFLYYSLQQRKPVFERVATGSTIKTIGLPFFIDLRIAAPTLPEQEVIAGCLHTLDECITAQSQKIDALKTHKKGLMQQLFPVPDEVRG